MKLNLRSLIQWVIITLTATIMGEWVQAQPITPANDGTGTIVTPEGHQFHIHGGQRSADGANLFHSFEEFGLDEGQTANFLSDPNLENILGRVTGDEASFINGLLQVSGGNSNLFLLNPAGIVFGPNASLNVPADFTATTATGIGFENHGWFNAVGENNWSSLVGNPNAFDFSGTTPGGLPLQPGAIVNEGNLAVATGHHLSLVGGTIVNTGSLQAPEGQITVTAVPEESFVRLSADGNVLSLEMTSPNSLTPSLPFTPLSLPELLTGGHSHHADRITVNPDGTLAIGGSGVSIDPQSGDAIVSGQVSVNSGQVLVNSGQSSIQVLGNRVGLFNAHLDASGLNGGGNLFIGGDFQGNGTIPNAQYTYIDSNTSIFADALQQGDGGQVIVWADNTTAFYGHISARGASLLPLPPSSSNGGFVEVSGADELIFQGTVDVSAIHGHWGTLLLDPENLLISRTENNASVEIPLPQLFQDDLADEVTLDAATLENQMANVVLEATNDITIDSGVSLEFSPGGGSIEFRADADGDRMGTFSMDSGQSIVAPSRDVTISGATIDIGNIDTSADGDDGGNITLTTTYGDDLIIGNLLPLVEGEEGIDGEIVLPVDPDTGSISTGNLNAYSELGDGGAIALEATSGDITTAHLNSSSSGDGMGGDISIVIDGEMGSIDTTAGAINSSSLNGNGGAIELTTQSGNILTNSITSTGLDAGEIDFFSGGAIEILHRIVSIGGNHGGDVTLDAVGNITIGGNNNSPIVLSGLNGSSGNLSLESDGSIQVFSPLVSSSGNGLGGDILVDAAGHVVLERVEASFLNQPGGRINIRAGNDITLRENLTTNQNSITFNAPVLLGDDISIAIFGDGNIVFNDSIDGDGALTLTPETGTVTLGGSIGSSTPLASLNLEGDVLSSDGAIDITTTGDLIVQDLTSEFGINLTSLSGNIWAEVLDSSSFLGENSGNINLSGHQITLAQLNAQSGNGVGGNVEVTAHNFFQVTDLFVDRNGINASISTAGELGGGSIAISHGGDGVTPFLVGDAAINGTAGAITRGLEPEQTITPISSYLYTHTQDRDGLQISSVPAPPPPEDPLPPENLDPDSDSESDIPSTPPSETPPLEDPLPPENLPDADSESDIPSTPPSETPPLEDPLPRENLDPDADSESDLSLNPVPSSPSLEETPPSENVLDSNLDGDLSLNPVPSSPSLEETPSSENFPSNPPSSSPPPEEEVGGERDAQLLVETDLGDEPDFNAIAENDESSNSTGDVGSSTDSDPEEMTDADSTLDRPIETDLAVDPEESGESELDFNSDKRELLASFIAEILGGTLSIDPDPETGDLEFTWVMPEGDGDIALNVPYIEPDSEEDVTRIPSLPHVDTEANPDPLPEEIELEVDAEIPLEDIAEIEVPEAESAVEIEPSPAWEAVVPQLSETVQPLEPPEIEPSTPIENTEAIDESNHDRNDGVSRPEVGEKDQTHAILTNPESSLSSTQTPLPLAEPSETVPSSITPENGEEAAIEIEQQFEAQYDEYLGDGFQDDGPEITPELMRETLKTIEADTGKKPAIVYAKTLSTSQRSDGTTLEGEELTLVLVVPQGPPIVKTVQLERHQLRHTVRIFLNNLNTPRSDSYRPVSQQLYQWLVQPLEEPLNALGIDTLIFSMDAGLRALPLAALHDGQQFLVERYSLGTIPSLGLTDTHYKSVENAQVLAMGASEFPNSGHPPLPAVPVSLSTIVGPPQPASGEMQKSDLPTPTGRGLWRGQSFLNEAFTLENLIRQRRQQGNFSIIHLATHARFDPARHHEAYIQLWDQRLSLDGLRQARWYGPPIVELLVLSACETAIGDENAEMGFAGLAVRSGAKSALASLWKVSDIGTLAVMSQFYHHLREAPIKAEALRQAQLAMLRGEVQIWESEMSGGPERVSLPPELGNWDGWDLSHPYYWAGFTMVGSPW